MDEVGSGSLVAAASVDDKRAGLLAIWSEVRALAGVEMLLSWDQETMMPAAAAESRALQLSTLAGIRHDVLVGEAMQRALEALEDGGSRDPVDLALLREARRSVDRARKIPPSLARELAAARSRGVASWQQARAANRFAVFRGALARLLELKREEARALNADCPYDALLDEYEPGLTTSSLEELFQPLERSLAQLVRDVGDSVRRPDATVLRGSFPRARQLELGRMVARTVGFDFERGRLDGSAHPFCMGVAACDVRLTWRGDDDDFRPGLFGILHEVGHGLYEQGLPADWQGSPLGEAASLGIHESQSRLWENHVGRSAEFWRWLLPHFRAAFPGFAATRAEEVVPALRLVEPSPVRVDADETTYNLHVIARFRLERALFGGGLSVDDLPAAWSAEIERLLGVAVPDDNRGALQDIHWAAGLFGYFPTYTLGNLVAAQLFEAACCDLPDLGDRVARGEFVPLLSWLRERVHRRGASLPPAELVAAATGKPLSTEPFLRYVTDSCKAHYS
jgi:carboxypeptidase Taq